jgi:transcriptional regulator with XRE-family HTH domain
VGRRRHNQNLAAQVGRKIKELRHSQGWSQERLAEAAALDRSYIAGIEVGARNPSLKAIEKLAAALSVAPAQLFEP